MKDLSFENKRLSQQRRAIPNKATMILVQNSEYIGIFILIPHISRIAMITKPTVKLSIANAKHVAPVYSSILLIILATLDGIFPPPFSDVKDIHNIPKNSLWCKISSTAHYEPLDFLIIQLIY